MALRGVYKITGIVDDPVSTHKQLKRVDIRQTLDHCAISAYNKEDGSMGFVLVRM